MSEYTFGLLKNQLPLVAVENLCSANCSKQTLSALAALVHESTALKEQLRFVATLISEVDDVPCEYHTRALNQAKVEYDEERHRFEATAPDSPGYLENKERMELARYKYRIMLHLREWL